MLNTDQILSYLTSIATDLTNEKISNSRVIDRLKRASTLFAMIADILREPSYHAISNGLGFLIHSFDRLPPIQVPDPEMKKAIMNARSKIANVLSNMTSNIEGISPQNPTDYCRVIGLIYETIGEVDSLAFEFAALMPPTKH